MLAIHAFRLFIRVFWPLLPSPQCTSDVLAIFHKGMCSFFPIRVHKSMDTHEREVTVVRTTERHMWAGRDVVLTSKEENFLSYLRLAYLRGLVDEDQPHS